MPDLTWFSVEERVQRLRETGMLECICQLRPTHPHWEGTGDISFGTAVRRKKIVWGEPSIPEKLSDCSSV